MQLTLSVKSSTMLSALVNAGGFGPGLAALDNSRDATSEAAGLVGFVAVGVDGSLSPMAAVSGRKREAMTMRWLRNELIVGDVGECVGNRVKKRRRQRRRRGMYAGRRKDGGELESTMTKGRVLRTLSGIPI